MSTHIVRIAQPAGTQRTAPRASVEGSVSVCVVYVSHLTEPRLDSSGRLEVRTRWHDEVDEDDEGSIGVDGVATESHRVCTHPMAYELRKTHAQGVRVHAVREASLKDSPSHQQLRGEWVRAFCVPAEQERTR